MTAVFLSCLFIVRRFFPSWTGASVCCVCPVCYVQMVHGQVRMTWLNCGFWCWNTCVSWCCVALAFRTMNCSQSWTSSLLFTRSAACACHLFLIRVPHVAWDCRNRPDQFSGHMAYSFTKPGFGLLPTLVAFDMAWLELSVTSVCLPVLRGENGLSYQHQSR